MWEEHLRGAQGPRGIGGAVLRLCFPLLPLPRLQLSLSTMETPDKPAFCRAVLGSCLVLRRAQSCRRICRGEMMDMP